jgi:hypothetical protein
MFAYTQDVPIGLDTYGRIVDAIGPEPLAGQIVHLVVEKEDGTLQYIDVWESREAFDAAMNERIHAAVDAAFGGARPAQEPTSTPLAVVEVWCNAARVSAA